MISIGYMRVQYKLFLYKSDPHHLEHAIKS
jgi:hypothetical protein